MFSYSEHIKVVFILGIISLVVNGFAWSYGFFKTPKVMAERKLPLSIFHVLGAFCVYLLAGFFLPHLIMSWLSIFQSSTRVSFALLLSFVSCFFFSGSFHIHSSRAS